LELTSPIAEKGNANVVSDAATAAHLAFAAFHSALVNVNINLKFLKDVELVKEGRGKVEALTVSAERSYVAARAACTKTLGIAI
jgi:formiminotetrahydrofolate cyclodeaminase